MKSLIILVWNARIFILTLSPMGEVYLEFRPSYWKTLPLFVVFFFHTSHLFLIRYDLIS